MTEPEAAAINTEKQTTDSSTNPSETLLSALLTVGINQPPDLFSALLAMDREDLQASMAELPSNAGPIRRRKMNCIRFQPARIKRIIQSDEEIGRIKDGVPAAIGKAMEHFAEVFLLECAKEANIAKCRQLKPPHLKAVMLKNPCFSFLGKILGEVAIPNSKKTEALTPTEKEKKSESADAPVL